MYESDIPVVTIGAKEYYVLNSIGTKYFILAKHCAGKGYYSLAPCRFADSKLSAYLQRHFVTDLRAAGVDTDRLYNISIMTLGQFQRFVRGKLPPLDVPYLLMNTVEDSPELIYAVYPDESVQPVDIRSTQGIRIAMHIDRDYANELMGVVELPAVEQTPEAEETTDETASGTSDQEDDDITIEVVDTGEPDIPDVPAIQEQQPEAPAEPEKAEAEEVKKSDDAEDDITITVIDTDEPEPAETVPETKPEPETSVENETDIDDITIEIIDDNEPDTTEPVQPEIFEIPSNSHATEKIAGEEKEDNGTEAADDDDIVIEIVDDDEPAEEKIEKPVEEKPEEKAETEQDDDIRIEVEIEDETEPEPEQTEHIEKTEKAEEAKTVETVEPVKEVEKVEEVKEESREEAIEAPVSVEPVDEQTATTIANRICRLHVVTYLDGRKTRVFDDAVEVNGAGYTGEDFFVELPAGKEYTIKARRNDKSRMLDTVSSGRLDADETVELNYYTVHVSGDSGIGFVEGGGLYLEGTACSIDVSVVPGHEFDCWTGNPDNKANPYDFIVTGRRYLKARSRISVRVQFQVDGEPYVGAAFICGMVHINGVDIPVSEDGKAETTVPSDTPVIVKVPAFSGDDATVQIYDDIPSADLLLPVRYLTLYIRGDNGLAYINGAGIYREGSVVNVAMGCKAGYRLQKTAKFYGNSFVTAGDGTGTIRLTQPTMYKVTTSRY